GMELGMLDRFFLARSPAPVDSRIAVITIDESDIKQVGQYPLPDQILARAIKRLKSYQPRAIGLDFYRDLPVEPGYQQLIEVFKTTPNLIGIEKIVGTQIDPPPVLAELGQVGLADQVLDGDGKLRRALLSVQIPNGQLRLNLGLQLALLYLEAEEILPLPQATNPTKIQLGKTVLVPFHPNDGGYVRADSGGYQILLNYHGTEKHFQTFSITDLLDNRIPQELVRDRVILIGSTAESVNDLFQTPYSNRLFGPPKQMAGVIVHANITSQILSASLDGRPLLQVWSEPVEWLWILLWSWLGAALAWQLKSPRSTTAFIALAGVLLWAIAYLAFLDSLWLPVVPSTLGLILAAILLPSVAAKHIEKIQLRETLRLLLAVTRYQPAAGQIAIEYLKQAESKEGVAFIEKMIRNSQSL
ncbi:MAG: CHASE2 domain-containing protein, partial [Scytonema sp. PMC 1069.18]|nr:CHASE2 domain-containing protein [Scytonema sp. PMC 1069.18]